MPLHRAVEWLSIYGRRYPQAWDLFARLQKDPPEPWPSWCWCPLAGAHGVIAKHHEFWQTDPLPDTAALGAIAAWRATQGIYRFDETLLQELLETDLNGDLPGQVLTRLPEWCVYVETPGLFLKDNPVHGFFSHLEWDFDAKEMELRFAIDVGPAPDQGPDFQSLITCMLDCRGTIEEGFESARARARKYGMKWFRDAVMYDRRDLSPEEVDAEAERLWAIEGAHLEFLLRQLTSVVLYLCAKDADVPPVDKRPVRYAVTKKGRVMTPSAKAPTIRPCGTVLGPQLRRVRERAEEEARIIGQKTGRTVRPHIRSARWCTYWTGPKKDKEGNPLVQTPIAHYLHVVAVNMKPGEAPPAATVRSVKKEEEI